LRKDELRARSSFARIIMLDYAKETGLIKTQLFVRSTKGATYKDFGL